MTKEIDTYKLSGLLDTFKNALLWVWYVLAIILCLGLWFFPVPEKSMQAFMLAAVLAVYSGMSVMVAKLESLRQELK